MEYNKQLEYIRRAVPIYQKHYGQDHIEFARTLVELGKAHGNFGKYQKQIECLEGASPIFNQHYGPEHPRTAGLLKDIGIAYQQLNKVNNVVKYVKIFYWNDCLYANYSFWKVVFV